MVDRRIKLGTAAKYRCRVSQIIFGAARSHAHPFFVIPLAPSRGEVY